MSFIFPDIDDGSSTFLCWTRGKRACTLLRLHEELPEIAIDMDSKQSTTAYHLAKIVWIHKRIVMKCNGSHIDALLQDMTITVASHQLLTNSEDKLFKLLILNAISGPMWVCFDTLLYLSSIAFPFFRCSLFWCNQDVTASSMGKKMIQRLEREHSVETETSRLTLQNVWGYQVCQVNTLVRAWNLLQGLLK